jgi:hypothetical protein
MCARILSFLAIALGLIALPVPVSATILTLTFDDIATTPDQILNFYNGGLTAAGQGPGPAYGITFSTNALVVTAPTPIVPGNHRLQVPATETVFVNVPSGLGPLFSFYYSTNGQATLTAWDGPNGTGNILSTVQVLSASFDFASIPDIAATRSFTIAATATLNADNLTFGEASVVPEPSTVIVTTSALLAFALRVRRLRRS